jgi:uncharacterized RDD family membrane protein YckC
MPMVDKEQHEQQPQEPVPGDSVAPGSPAGGQKPEAEDLPSGESQAVQPGGKENSGWAGQPVEWGSSQESSSAEPGQQLPEPIPEPPLIIPLTDSQPPGSVTAEGMVYSPAGLWPRVGAFLIDFIILALISQLVLLIVDLPFPETEEVMALMQRMISDFMQKGDISRGTWQQYVELNQYVRVAGWLNVAACGAYFTVFHGLVGATLGKMCMGLVVLRRDGTALGVGWALLRYLGYFILAKLIYTAWLIPFDKQRRTLYDMVLGTNVFRRRTLDARLDSVK